MTIKKDMDKRRLREAFFRIYDHGRVSDYLARLASGRIVSGLSLIGEGMHFRCWREEKIGAEMELVFKVASQDFVSEVGNLSSWHAGLSRMPRDTDLMPPIGVVPLKIGSMVSIGLAMPYGPDSEDRCSDWWQPVSERVAAFNEGARLGGLAFGDIPQIRCWDGIPFMIDISDLRAL